MRYLKNGLNLFSIVILMIACGSTDGASKKGDSDSGAPEVFGKKMSDLNLSGLYAGELPMVSQASLVDGASKNSAASCDVRKKVASIKKETVSAAPEKFCNDADIFIDTKYNVKVNFDNGSSDTYGFYVHQTDDNLYQITQCRENVVTYAATLKTPGDGTGSVHSLNVSNTMAYYYKFTKNNATDGLIQLESGQNRTQGENKQALLQKIEFDGKDGFSSLSIYSNFPPAGAEKYAHFSRSLTKFDSSFGHMLKFYGYPLDEDEQNHNIQKEEFFDATGNLVDESATSQFSEGGTLTIDTDELPPILDQGLAIEEISTWNCLGIDEDITISCTLKTAQEDSGSGDCGFE